MTPADASSDDIDLLLIDGDNLLHDVRGGRGQGGVAWLLPRLSGWRPPQLRIVVALDGHPPPGETRRQRVTRGIEFQHSGSRSADDLLIELLGAQPYAERARTVVVSRDRSLRARATRAGGLTRSTDWLMRLVAGPAAGGASARPPVRIGRGKPPPTADHGQQANDGPDRPGWEPGRGATRKKGNPKRVAKSARRR